MEVTVDLRRLGATYEDVRARIVELVADIDDQAASKPVPACPAWSIHDVLAHVTGNCTNILTGELEGIATEAWTQAQVDARKDMTIIEILAEWEQAAPQIAAIVDDFPGWIGTQVVGDLAVHEHDLRGALDKPGERDSEAVRIAIEFMVAGFLHPAAVMFGLGPLEVKIEDRTWIVGSGEPPSGPTDQRAVWIAAVSTVQPEPEPSGPPVGQLDVPRFELFRAITGRRSAAQIRRFDWSVDPEPYLRMFDFDPFALRPTDLVE